MRNSRLIQLMDSLSSKELRQLRKVVRSPFFNQRQDLIRLFDFLTEQLLIIKQIPSKEKASQYIYPKEKYDPQRIRFLMSLLTKTIEKYLAYQAFDEDEIGVKLKLAQVYREKKLDNFFNKTVADASNILEKQQLRNGTHYSNKYEIQNEKYLHTSLGKRNIEQNLQLISDNLDIAYISMKLKQTCISLSHQTVYKKDYNFNFLPELIKPLVTSELLDVPAIGAYYHCYHALIDLKNEHHFQSLKTIILDNAACFSNREIQDLFLLAINYCIRKVNNGKKEFAQIGLDLYKTGLKKEILYTDGYLTPYTYRNIIALGLIIKEYEWVENFLHDYKIALEKKHRESIFSFNLAKLEYERKNFDHALSLLQQSHYKDLLLNLAAKTITLKIYYELNEYKLLDSHLDSMKIFIRRKKIIGYHKKNYLNLIYYVKALTELNYYDAQAKKTLIQKIETEEILMEKAWLLEQVKTVGSY